MVICLIYRANQTQKGDFREILNLFHLVHGSHLEQMIFATTKWVARYQGQDLCLTAQALCLILLSQL